MQFRKKPYLVEAITFDELVQYGLSTGAGAINGMPWSFQYKGHGITHENDECYLVPPPAGIVASQRMTPGHMLVTTDDCIIVLSLVQFHAMYETIEPAQHEKIKGYRTLSDTEIDLMNEGKALAEQVGAYVAKLRSYPSIGFLSGNVARAEGDIALDQHWISIGTTDLQTGFMALIRGIAQPTTF